uniref:G_PROTEIN_RECEP_F1_2 domain-containing protein n=1 Tax=Strongyloides venezuelensis TaxID=75913 RepID=A0A0K0G5K7_STRVS
MYLFAKTIFSQCPNESYCIVLSILNIILIIVQLILIFYLVTNYKKSNNDYIKFLTFNKIFSFTVFLFISIFGEIKTFFPRKVVACYGLIRLVGDTGCQITISITIPFIMVECLFILYAFNGQYNTLCRKKKFHQNSLIQRLSFTLFFLCVLTVYVTLYLSYSPREKIISNVISTHEDIKFLTNNNYSFTGVVDAKRITFLIGSASMLTFYVNYIVHYAYIFNKMLKFLREIKELGQISNQNNKNYLNKFKHHIKNVVIPVILIYVPLGIFMVCLIFYRDEKYFWITKKLSNMLQYTVYLYGITSPSYTLYFILTSELKSNKIFIKKLTSNTLQIKRKK